MADTHHRLAGLAMVIGEPARATMLTALMGGTALTATELAMTAGIAKPTASAHLTRLLKSRLVAVERQGRHRYFRLADRDVAHLLERMIGAADRLHVTPTPGPADPAQRKARVCYDHLAGELGVLVFDSFERRRFLRSFGSELELTDAGTAFCGEFAIDVVALAESRRPLCRACLDWSVRRHHLAGAVGAAVLHRIMDLGWARRSRGTRTLVFNVNGERALRQRFSLPRTGS